MRASVLGALLLALRLALLLAAAAPGPARAASATVADLAAVNVALEAWLSLIDADRPFLVLDGSAGRLRLHHGTALLRADSVWAVSPLTAGVQRLEVHVRRYRRADPYHEVEPGPFDWEDYLVTAAGDDVALWFDGGLLITAGDAWAPERDPYLRLAPAALRALYDAVADSTALVVLPSGWDAMTEGAAP